MRRCRAGENRLHGDSERALGDAVQYMLRCPRVGAAVSCTVRKTHTGLCHLQTGEPPCPFPLLPLKTGWANGNLALGL